MDSKKTRISKLKIKTDIDNNENIEDKDIKKRISTSFESLNKPLNKPSNRFSNKSFNKHYDKYGRSAPIIIRK